MVCKCRCRYSVNTYGMRRDALPTPAAASTMSPVLVEVEEIRHETPSHSSASATKSEEFPASIFRGANRRGGTALGHPVGPVSSRTSLAADGYQTSGILRASEGRQNI